MIGGDTVLGLDTNDAQFIQFGREVFTNTARPGYSSLSYPHPITGLTNSTGNKGFTGIKISQLPPTTAALSGAELIPAANGGTNLAVTAAQIAALAILANGNVSRLHVTNDSYMGDTVTFGGGSHISGGDGTFYGPISAIGLLSDSFGVFPQSSDILTKTGNGSGLKNLPNTNNVFYSPTILQASLPTGLSVWVDGFDLVNSNAGAALKTWPNRTGGFAVTNSTGTVPLVYADGSGPYVVFNSSQMNISTNIVINCTNYAIFFICRPLVQAGMGAGFQMLFRTGGSGYNATFQLDTFNNSYLPVLGIYNNGGGNNYDTLPFVESDVSLIGVSVNATNVTFVSNNHTLSFYNSGTVTSDLGASLFDTSSAMAVYGILFFTNQVPASGFDSIRGLAKTHGAMKPVSRTVIIGGNSIPSGIGQSDGQGAPYMLAKKIQKPGVRVWNCATPSATGSNMLLQFQSLVAPLIKNAGDPVTEFYGETRNDIVVGPMNSTNAANNVLLYCKSIQAAGATAIAETCLPSSGLAVTDQTNANNIIRNFVTNGIPVCDIAANPFIGGTSPNATYYADSVHLNNLGQAIKAQIEADFLATNNVLPCANFADISLNFTSFYNQTSGPTWWGISNQFKSWSSNNAAQSAAPQVFYRYFNAASNSVDIPK